MREFFAPDHTWDGVHPNPRGELRVAAAFADVLAQRFGVGTRYPRPFPEVSNVPARFKSAATAALHLEAAHGGIRAIAIEDALVAAGARPDDLATRTGSAGEQLQTA